jgi:hypothetical protein
MYEKTMLISPGLERVITHIPIQDITAAQRCGERIPHHLPGPATHGIHWTVQPYRIIYDRINSINPCFAYGKRKKVFAGLGLCGIKQRLPLAGSEGNGPEKEDKQVSRHRGVYLRE